MMLRSKYILIFVLLFTGAQFVASQFVASSDAIDIIDDYIELKEMVGYND